MQLLYAITVRLGQEKGKFLLIGENATLIYIFPAMFK